MDFFRAPVYAFCYHLNNGNSEYLVLVRNTLKSLFLMYGRLRSHCLVPRFTYPCIPTSSPWALFRLIFIASFKAGQRCSRLFYYKYTSKLLKKLQNTFIRADERSCEQRNRGPMLSSRLLSTSSASARLKTQSVEFRYLTIDAIVLKTFSSCDIMRLISSSLWVIISRSVTSRFLSETRPVRTKIR